MVNNGWFYQPILTAINHDFVKLDFVSSTITKEINRICSGNIALANPPLSIDGLLIASFPLLCFMMKSISMDDARQN